LDGVRATYDPQGRFPYGDHWTTRQEVAR
jgi:hypothetical protein